MSSEKKLEERANNLVEKWIERYRRGSLRFFIVHLLLHKHHHKASDKTKTSSFHGYKLAQKIDEVTKGKWHPTTASIYPVLKELNEEEVLDRIPGVEQQKTGRTVIEYQLTPFGLKVARKLEEARKDFARAFITGEGKHVPPPLFPIGRHLPPGEVREIVSQASDEVLNNHCFHIKKKIGYGQDQLKIIEEELDRRKKGV